IALNDMHALGACAAVRDRNRAVPDDVSVVGIDDIALASLLYPPLTTVHQPIDKLSEAAVDLLVGRLGPDGGGPVRHVVLDPHLVVRGSTARPGAAAPQRETIGRPWSGAVTISQGQTDMPAPLGERRSGSEGRNQ